MNFYMTFKHCLTGSAYAKILLKLKLTFFILTAVILQVSANSFAQITIREKEAPLAQIIQKIRKQTGYDFFYNAGMLAKAKPVTLNVKDASVREVLDLCFKNQPLTYTIEQNAIVVKDADERAVVANLQAVITGKVIDENGKPIPGATIRIKGSTAGAVVSSPDGSFRISANAEDDILIVSYIGYKSQEIRLKADLGVLTVRLEVEENQMKDVVITGMTVRKKESFTGAAATFTGEELKQVNNQNIIQSLRTLDPSFIQIENNSVGSDPNQLPTIELRGQTSISSGALRDQFLSDPNQPLFILDGFESPLKTIIDLDMNMIASVTILKDASSTAIYGSRAANGVIVVETKKPLPGKVRFSYTTDMQMQLPDLTSYNMMNASEKLQFERFSGLYNSSVVPYQLTLDSVYNARLKEVERGVETYWLSQPLQTGFSHRHSINASGGDNSFRYDIGANVRNNDATMIGSTRNDWGANAMLSYRAKRINFSNRIYLSGVNSENSPYGSFSSWVNTNPYYRILDANEMFLEDINTIAITQRTPNPFYNASLRSFDRTQDFNIQNNFQVNANLSDAFKIDFNAQIIKDESERNSFLSPLHTSFFTTAYARVDPTLRGEYDYTEKNRIGYTANLSATYAKVFAEKHLLNAFGRVEFQDTKNTLNGYSAVGFPDGSNGNPAFAYGFVPDGTPSSATTITRRNSYVASVNYSYDQRFNLDANLNVDGSTAFGSEHRYSKPYYSMGLSWNINREEFMQDISWVNSLRLRGNIGTSGNQNFGNVSQSVYNYYSSVNSLGQGVYLSALGAPYLKWQKTKQTSLGVDASLLNNTLNVQFNVYEKLTDPLVVAITLPSSTGLSNYPFNAGTSKTKGWEAILRYSPVYRPGEFVWTFGVTAAGLQQQYADFNSLLNTLNEELQNSNSLTQYKDGYSAYDIWAVPSLGIDPTTGREVFLAKNGQHTFSYSSSDRVVVGNSRPSVEGVFSSNMNYKGLTATINIRYIIDKEVLNTSLYEKVENISRSDLIYNQDKRALYDRWQNPGDVSQFKAISLTGTTPMSSRFIQNETSFTGEAVSVGYEFSNKEWLSKAYLSNLSVRAFTNEFFYASNVRRERGIDYPFARSISMSIRATLK